MYGVLKRVEQQSGDDIQMRLTLSFDALFSRERDTSLGALFDYWREVTRSGVVVTEEQFCPIDVLPNDTTHWMTWLDTRALSPMNFIWHDHLYSREGGASDKFMDPSGVRVRDYGFKLHGRFCAAEYFLCKNLKRPLYHEIEQWTGREHRHYLRLLLPVLSARGDVSRLVYVCRRI